MSIIKNIISKIEEYESIVILRHRSPDFDAIGSQMGLALSLRGSYPDKKIYVTGELPERFEDLVTMDDIDDDTFKESLMIIVDTAAEHLISDTRYKTGRFIIKIDHHIDREPFGDISYVDTSAAAAAEIIASFIFDENLHIDENTAKMLMFGLVTDSGRFLYSSVSHRTFSVAEKLMTFGFNLEKVYQKLYLEDMEVRRLRGHFMSNFKTTPGGVAYMKNDSDFVSSSGLDAFTISRGMVNTMKDIKGISIWANFTQDQDGIIVDLRSSGPPVNEVASQFGGGGHKRAAGAKLKDWDSVDSMLKALEELAVSEGI